MLYGSGRVWKGSGALGVCRSLFALLVACDLLLHQTHAQSGHSWLVKH